MNLLVFREVILFDMGRGKILEEVEEVSYNLNKTVSRLGKTPTGFSSTFSSMGRRNASPLCPLDEGRGDVGIN